MKRVAITGLGIYSCIGTCLDQVKDSLYKGKSGIVLCEDRLQYGYKSALTGFLKEPNLKDCLDRRQRICLSQQGEYAYLSTLEALKTAGIDTDFFEKHSVGIIFGNDSSMQPIVETCKKMEQEHDTQRIGSAKVFQSINSTVSMNLSTIFKLKGVNFSLSAACASASHAIGTAAMFIRSGLQDMIICGGAQEVNLYSVMSFDALGVFSSMQQSPQKASRPFDRDRNGLVPSGGAATLVLEDMDKAKKRGAKIYGEIIGYGFSSSGGKITEANPESEVLAIENALKDSQMQLSDIDYINAHATSTQEGDKAEAMALYKVFGDKMPMVSSTKSMTGHECWMSGASEVVYSLLMMHNDFLAPNINFENPDQETSKLNLITQTCQKQTNCFMTNSFGFGGTNAVLIVKK